jgi:rhodanese-related sulfurtransferase
MLDGVSRLFGPKTRTVLIDCRESWRYNKAHIPNAINIPFGQMRNRLYELDDAGIIIVSGETYKDPVAVAMSKTLMELGFKEVKTLRGGILGWVEAEKPVISN